MAHTLAQDMVVCALRLNKMDAQIVRICTAILLSGTYSSSKIKAVLVQKVDESIQKSDLLRQFLKIVHEFGLKAGYHRILNMDHIESEMKTSNELHHISRQFSVLVPEDLDRLTSFGVVSKYGLSFYSWSVFRMDDFDFSTNQYSISPKLKLNWFDDKSPQQNLTIPEDNLKAPEEDPNITREIHLNDLIWIRPTISSKKGSMRHISRSSDDQTMLNFSKPGRPSRTNLEVEQKDLDIDNIEALFDFQSSLEETKPFDDSCYDKLRLKEAQSSDFKSRCGSRCDDSYVLFYGLTHMEPSLYERELSQFSLKNFYSNPPVLLMKCYQSSYEDDVELRNLVRSLGCAFTCLPTYLLPEVAAPPTPLDTPGLSPHQLPSSDIILVQGVSSMCYAVIDQDLKTLQRLLDDPRRLLQPGKTGTSPSSTAAAGTYPLLILYGFEAEIEEFKTKNILMVKQFDRVISLAKSFDVDVLQVQVTQVTPAHLEHEVGLQLEMAERETRHTGTRKCSFH